MIIKGTDKGSWTVVWDREDYLTKPRNQLEDKELYQELKGNVESRLLKIIKSDSQNVRNRKNISDATFNYFLVYNSKLGINKNRRKYILQK